MTSSFIRRGVRVVRGRGERRGSVREMVRVALLASRAASSHVFGRGANGASLEPKGTVWLCTWHHLGVIHRLWRRLGIDVVDEHATRAEVFRTGLRRAATLADLAGNCEEPVALDLASWSAVAHF